MGHVAPRNPPSMKSRIIWAAVLLAAGVGFYVMTIRPTLTPTPPKVNRRLLKDVRPPEIPPPPLPAPNFATPVIPPPTLPIATAMPAVGAKSATRWPLPMVVPIQDGATIDFSIGAPVVRSQGDDKAALDRALREMAEATKNTKFEPKK